MAILNIRKLPDHVHTQLRLRAARNARSMEAEARAILQQACSTGYNSADYSGTDGSSQVHDSAEPDATITLTPQQLSEARKFAHLQGVTLQDVIPMLLSRMDTTDDNWAKRLFAMMDEAGGNSHGVKWTRDELYRV
jgi:plasmid stability protein